MKRTLKAITITAILALITACGSSTEHSTSAMVDAPRIEDARLLDIHGTRNFRDLGGYQTADGRTVKAGMLFRSDNLAHLDDAGLEDISALNVKVVTDFRSDKERQQEPDQLPEGVEYNVLPINDKPVDIRKLSRKIIMGRIKEDEVMNLLDHRRFITNAAHRQSWGDWVESLADDAATPQIYHCTSGKDRAGYGTAIVLLTLGMNKDVVMEDFLFSNAVLKGYNDATIAKIEERVGKRESLETIRMIMGVKRETLETTFATMEADYGSIDGFIRDGLGIDAATRQALQDKFLKAPAQQD